MIIKVYAAGRIAEIHIDLAEETPAAMDLVRVMLACGVTAAKIIRTTQTAKESPLSAVCDPTGERAVTS